MTDARYVCPLCEKSLLIGQTPTDQWRWENDQAFHASCVEAREAAEYARKPPEMTERGHWDDADKARRFHAEGKLSTDAYLTGLFYHPDFCLYWSESGRLERVEAPQP